MSRETTQRHDHSYKLIFSEPRSVRDLLRGFVREEWVERLDLDSLERVNGHYVTDDVRERESDVIWRVRLGDEWLYVFLLIEFQSSVDPFMALRIMTYVGLLYQDLARQKTLTPEGRLPPVLPLVLYNGERRWSAPLDIADLVQAVPGGLEAYLPRLRYLLLDEGVIARDENFSEETRNIVSAIFQLENFRDEAHLSNLSGLLLQWLPGPENARLRRYLALWLKNVVLRNWVPESEHWNWQSINDLNEVNNMLAERAKWWTEQWKRQGLEEGRQEGLEEGRQEGRREGEQSRALQVARGLIEQTSMDDATIAELAGLDIHWVEKLRVEASR